MRRERPVFGGCPRQHRPLSLSLSRSSAVFASERRWEPGRNGRRRETFPEPFPPLWGFLLSSYDSRISSLAAGFVPALRGPRKRRSGPPPRGRKRRKRGRPAGSPPPGPLSSYPISSIADCSSVCMFRAFLCMDRAAVVVHDEGGADLWFEWYFIAVVVVVLHLLLSAGLLSAGRSLDGLMDEIHLSSLKENRLFKCAFAVVGIMSTLLVYGILQASSVL